MLGPRHVEPRHVACVGDDASGRQAFTGSAVTLVLLSTALTSMLAFLIVPLTGIELSASIAALAPVVAGAISLQAIRFAVWQCQHRPLPAAVLSEEAMKYAGEFEEQPRHVVAINSFAIGRFEVTHSEGAPAAAP